MNRVASTDDGTTRDANAMSRDYVESLQFTAKEGTEYEKEIGFLGQISSIYIMTKGTEKLNKRFGVA